MGETVTAQPYLNRCPPADRAGTRERDCDGTSGPQEKPDLRCGKRIERATATDLPVLNRIVPPDAAETQL